MKIYQTEINDGLKSELKNNSIAYTSIIEPTESKQELVGPINIEHPAKANLEDWDLFHFNSILVSVGWNENDDVFTPKETWLAKSSPVLKKVNYMHNETDIIGVMTASLALDNQGKTLPDNVDPPEQFDIAVSAALYRKWEDPVLQERMDTIIEEISLGEWRVSMECLFRDFDYALIDNNGEHSVLERTKATSFLTKHLRWYGGTGQYQNYTIGRILKDFTFSGKGLVRNPANKRSIIFNTKAFKTNLNNTEILMSGENDSKDLLKAQATIEKLQDELKQKVEAAAQAERDKLEKQISAQEKTIAKLTEDLKTVESTVASKDESISKLEKEKNDISSDFTKAKEELEATKAEQIKSNRVSQLVSASISKEEALDIVEKWSTASDEQFDSIAKLYTEAAKKEVKEEKEDKEDGKDKKKEDKKNETADMSKASVEEKDDIALNVDTDDESVDTEFDAAVAFFSKAFKVNETK